MRYFFVLITWFTALCADPTDFKTGTLPNGLQYYICAGELTEREVSIHLVVKTGSIYESEEERGLAHFVEHMVFRGSKHFKDHEVIEFIESMGGIFGADANAETNFETTHYFFDLPKTTPHNLETALSILSDMAGRASFSEELIDLERGIVLDELHRGSHNPYAITARKQLELVFGSSCYQNRLPIGAAEVIEKAPAETIRHFYHKWYRPDRMAVIVAGEIEESEIVSYIEQYFGSLQNPEEEAIEFPLDEPFFTSNQLLFHIDPELTATSLLIEHYDLNRGRVFDLEHAGEIASDLMLQVLMDRRIDSLADRYPHLFLATWWDQEEDTQYYSRMQLGTICFEDKLVEAVDVLHREMLSVFQHGFSESEFKKVKKELISVLEESLEEHEQEKASEFIEMSIQHFLLGHPIIDTAALTLGVLENMAPLKKEEIKGSIFQKLFAENCLITVASPHEQLREKINPAALAHQFFRAIPTSVDPVVIESYQKVDFRSPVEEGSLVETEHNVEKNIFRYRLSSGIEVVAKKTALKKGEIEFLAQAKGGLAGVEAESYPSAALATAYFEESGMGGLNGMALSEFLAENRLQAHLRLSNNQRSISLQASDGNLELMFQLVHGLFTSKQFSKTAWDTVVARSLEAQKIHDKNPDGMFMRFVDKTLFPDCFLFEPLDFSKTDAAVAEQVFERAFSNPADFLFTIAGDFEEEALEAQVVRYLGSISCVPQTSLVVPNSKYAIRREEKSGIFKAGHQMGSETCMSLPIDLKAVSLKLENLAIPYAATLILERRLFEVIRSKMGASYGITVHIVQPFYPSKESAYLAIEYSSMADKIDLIREAVLTEMERMKREPVSFEEAENVRKLFSLSQESGRKNNSFWTEWLSFLIRNEQSIFAPDRAQERIEAITPENIRLGASQMFAELTPITLSHLPLD